MSAFASLPVELLSPVLQHIVRPSHFASLCLVNSVFYSFAAPLLYRRAFIYAWNKDGKQKVVGHTMYVANVTDQSLHRL